jgi:hypothetical protein
VLIALAASLGLIIVVGSSAFCCRCMTVFFLFYVVYCPVVFMVSVCFVNVLADFIVCCSGSILYCCPAQPLIPSLVVLLNPDVRCTRPALTNVIAARYSPSCCSCVLGSCYSVIGSM